MATKKPKGKWGWFVAGLVVLIAILSTCGGDNFVDYGVRVLVAEAEAQMRPLEINWDHVPSSKGLDRNLYNQGLRPEFSHYQDYNLVFWGDNWTSRNGLQHGGWYGWVLVEKDGGKYLIVELGIDYESLVIDRMDAVYFP